MVVDPPDGKLPPLTPAGQHASRTRLKAPRGMERGDTWEDRHIWERCVTRGGMPNALFPRSYNNNIQLFQTPDHVVMLIEQVHEVRVIPLDGRDHPSKHIGQWNGISTGRWGGRHAGRGHLEPGAAGQRAAALVPVRLLGGLR